MQGNWWVTDGKADGQMTSIVLSTSSKVDIRKRIWLSQFVLFYYTCSYTTAHCSELMHHKVNSKQSHVDKVMLQQIPNVKVVQPFYHKT